jgi:hypothetical protein
MTPRPVMQVAFRHDIGTDLRLLIARVTGAPVHCVTLYGDQCIDATFGGVIVTDRATRLAAGRWEVYTIPAAFDSARAQRLGLSRVGWPYDWLGVVWAWWGGRAAGSGHRTKLFCSEQCADELLAAGVPLLYRRSARYTPRQLRDELRDRFGWRPFWVAP